ncbi:MAG: recombinase family protein [Xenococcaceae cyanobacterium]
MVKDLSRAVAYFRVSSLTQVHGTDTEQNYINRFLKYGFTKEQIIGDIGKSGGDNTREGYQRVLNLVRGKHIDSVFIPEITRFSRDIIDFEEAMGYFQITGVDLITLDGHKFRFDTPQNKTNVRMLILFAQQTREENQYRAIRGHQELRAAGKAIRSGFPYIKVDGRLIPNKNFYKDTGKTSWEIGREVIEVYLDCQNFHETLLRMTNKYGEEKIGKSWEDYPRSHSGLRKWISSQILKGNIEYFGDKNHRSKSKQAPDNSIIVYGTHEPLITLEESKEVEKIISIARDSRSKTSKVLNLWTGKLFCECGASLRVNQSIKWLNGKKYQNNYLYCTEASPNSDKMRRQRKLGLSVAKCKHRKSYGLTVEKLDKIVIDGLCSRAWEIANLTYPEKSSNILTPEIKELNEQIDKLKMIVGKDKELLAILNKRISHRDYLLKELGSKDSSHLREKLAEYGRDKEFWNKATPAQKKVLYSEFIDKIVCCSGKPTIFFTV